MLNLALQTHSAKSTLPYTYLQLYYQNQIFTIALSESKTSESRLCVLINFPPERLKL